MCYYGFGGDYLLPKIDSFYERLVYSKNNCGFKTNWSILADATGISKANFSRYKTGKYFPSAVTLLKISRLLGVNAFWLAGNDIKLPEDKIDLITLMYEALETDDKNEVFEFISNCFHGNEQNIDREDDE